MTTRKSSRKSVSKNRQATIDHSFGLVNIGISTGGMRICVLHRKTAARMGYRPGDRIKVSHKGSRTKVVAILDTTRTKLREDQIGLFTEAFADLKCRSGTQVIVDSYPKPESVYYISKKVKGAELTSEQMLSIIKSIVKFELTDIEMTYFVDACYQHDLTNAEVVALTNAMIDTGNPINFHKIYPNRPIVDKHCIGGVAGNRTTALVVPIMVAAGYIVPKTSSRSITSPAGTSDTIEVFSHVSLNKRKIISTVKKTGGCLVWGGALDLAPADDMLIKVEHPMSLDPVGLMIASILAKKKSVGSTHVLIDIPVGPSAKVKSRMKALRLKRRFEEVGKLLGMKVIVEITSAFEPIGNGIGPSLEARDILLTLRHDKKGSVQLFEKATTLAGLFFEELGKVKKGQGKKFAEDIIISGKAEKVFLAILKAQGLQNVRECKSITDCFDPEQILVGKLQYKYVALKAGNMKDIDNECISTIAKVLGAPFDKECGVYLHKHIGDTVNKHETILTLYANSNVKLTAAKNFIKKNQIVKIAR